MPTIISMGSVNLWSKFYSINLEKSTVFYCVICLLVREFFFIKIWRNEQNERLYHNYFKISNFIPIRERLVLLLEMPTSTKQYCVLRSVTKHSSKCPRSYLFPDNIPDGTVPHESYTERQQFTIIWTIIDRHYAQTFYSPFLRLFDCIVKQLHITKTFFVTVSTVRVTQISFEN